VLLLFFLFSGFLHFVTSVHFVVRFLPLKKRVKKNGQDVEYPRHPRLSAVNSSYVKPSATADGTDLCDQPPRRPPKGGTPNYSPFTIYHSPFTIHHSPFIIHHSPFIIHTQDAAFISFYLRKPTVLGYNLMTALSQNILDQKEEQYEIF
jgi:hypothetical protein